MSVNPNQMLSQVAAQVQRIIGYGLLVLLSAAVVQKFGFRIPFVRTLDAMQLVSLCGAWWLLSTNAHK